MNADEGSGPVRASVRLAFGEPRQIGDRTIVPIAQVIELGWLGFGHGPRPGGTGEAAEEEAAGGGRIGWLSVRPLAVLEVGPEATRVRPIADRTAIWLSSFLLAGWSVYWIGRTLRAIFGR